MHDSLADTGLPSSPHPALPESTRQRWQPLRLSLIELFHYDSEEFLFRDGHLLLRGNNGTGKSKVLSLTPPFLFDAQLKSSRIQPDDDADWAPPCKAMANCSTLAARTGAPSTSACSSLAKCVMRR